MCERGRDEDTILAVSPRCSISIAAARIKHVVAMQHSFGFA